MSLIERKSEISAEDPIMPRVYPEFLVRRLRQLTTGAPAEPTSDGGLLEQYLDRQDEEAFAALVQRHGPMVWNVCRRVLADEHEAEDVFQAAFLILARKAGSIQRRASVKSWLYGVAYHLAVRARANAGRRQQLVRQAANRPAPDPLAEVSGRELIQMLDAELARLPERLRAPVLLCYLEGQSQEEAAEQLGWSKTTLRGRLERGRERLRSRLARLGLPLSAALLPAALVASAQGAPPEALTAATARVAASGAGVSASVQALVQGMTRTMLLARLRSGAVLLMLAVLGIGTVALTQAALTGRSPERQDREVVQQAAKEAPEADRPRTDLHGDPLPPEALARLGSARLRHAGRVEGVAFAPDGKTAVSAGTDGRVCLWEVPSGRLIRHYTGQADGDDEDAMAEAVALAPDGQKLAVGYSNADTHLRLFDVASGKELARPRGHTATVVHVTFLPDGRLLSASQDGSMRIWEVESGKELRRLGDKHTGLRHAAVSADGKQLATGGIDKTIQLWDVETGRGLGELKGHDDAIAGLAFAPDGRTLVSAGLNDRELRVWDLADKRLVRTLKASGPVAFRPDGKVLVSGGGLRMITLWQAETGQELRSFDGHKHNPLAFAITRDGRTLVSGGYDGTVRFWDPEKGKELSAPRGHDSLINAVAIAPDGKTVVTGSDDSTVRFWDPATGALLRMHDRAEYLSIPSTGRKIERVRNSRTIHAVGYSADGRRLLVGGYLTCLLADAVTGKRQVYFDVEDANLYHLLLSPDGKLVASAGQRRICLWDAATGKLRAKLPDHKGYIRAMVFAPDGKLLATTCDDKSGLIRLWDVATARLAHTLKSHNTAVGALAFAPDGSSLAAGGTEAGVHREEKSIELWEPATGRLLRTIKGKFHSANAMAYSPDGRTIAATAYDEVYLWEAATGKMRGKLVGHVGGVNDLAFAPDGRSLVSAGRDSTALVWDLTGGRRTTGVLSDQAWQAAWEELRGQDAVRAYRAMWTLASAAQTVPALREHLKPLTADQAAKFAHWVEDLDSASFDIRQQASAALEKQGYLAEPALQGVLERGPPLELRRRVQRLLEKVGDPPVERVHELRMLEVLGHAFAPEAQTLLEALAGGSPIDRLTRDARMLLDRRGKRVLSDDPRNGR